MRAVVILRAVTQHRLGEPGWVHICYKLSEVRYLGHMVHVPMQKGALGGSDTPQGTFL